MFAFTFLRRRMLKPHPARALRFSTTLRASPPCHPPLRAPLPLPQFLSPSSCCTALSSLPLPYQRECLPHSYGGSPCPDILTARLPLPLAQSLLVSPSPGIGVIRTLQRRREPLTPPLVAPASLAPQEIPPLALPLPPIARLICTCCALDASAMTKHTEIKLTHRIHLILSPWKHPLRSCFSPTVLGQRPETPPYIHHSLG